MVASAVQEADRAMTWALLGTSAAAEATTNHVGVVGPTGKAVGKDDGLVDGTGYTRALGTQRT